MRKIANIVIRILFLLFLITSCCYAETYPTPESFEKYPNEWEIIYSGYPYKGGEIMRFPLRNALIEVKYTKKVSTIVTASMLNYCCKRYEMWKSR